MPYRTWYKPGDWNVIDDMSGFRVKHSQTRRIPGGQTGGLVVDRKRWETQHPQDFVHGIVDDQTVPEARPRQPNRYMVTATFVTAQANRGSNRITVDSVEGFNPGDRIGVMLDTGENYFPIVAKISGNYMFLTQVLPATVGGPYNDIGMAGNYGGPIENTVLSLGPSGVAFLVDDNMRVPITDDDNNMINTQ